MVYNFGVVTRTTVPFILFSDPYYDTRLALPEFTFKRFGIFQGAAVLLIRAGQLTYLRSPDPRKFPRLRGNGIIP